MASQRIAVLGSTGQLGTDLVEVLRLDDKGETLPVSHADCDCTNANQVGEILSKLRPEVVINCAAYVRVDDCEDQRARSICRQRYWCAQRRPCLRGSGSAMRLYQHGLRFRWLQGITVCRIGPDSPHQRLWCIEVSGASIWSSRPRHIH